MNNNETAPTNRTYKDRVFCMLYRDKRNLLSLYNAVNGTNYADEEGIEVITLENAVFMGMRNDVAFLVNFFMNLYEHQSTWNPNMPYRFLQYVAREYEKLVVDQSMFASTPVRIPTPKFVTFYNGEQEAPDKTVLKLSDAYEVPVDDPELELKVTVYNINAGKNRELLEKCQSLREYSLFVERVRTKLSEKKPKDDRGKSEAVGEAVDECIREGILKEFLTQNRAEVIAMSIFEYDEEKEKELLRKAEFENGMQQGIQQGMLRGKSAGGWLKLIAQVCRKIPKGKTVPVIAEELEEDEAVIGKIYEIAENVVPQFDVEAIFAELSKSVEHGERRA